MRGVGMRTSRVMAAVALVVTVGSAAACSSPGGDRTAAPPANGTTDGGAAATSTPAGTVTPPAATATGTASGSLPAKLPGSAGGPLPLWPFHTLAEARAWQQDYRSGGHQPWHTSAEQTALSFVSGFLGFTGIDRVARREIGDTEAWITVGVRVPSGKISSAAAVHLVRFGAGRDAPWEVVGTRDTDLTLTSPAYGATVTTPLRAGGRITGVDESLRVQVRAEAGKAIGETCCQPAGGTATPWSSDVDFGRPDSTVLTVVVSTGGHVADVERFAITGVRVGSTG
jgi:hypothetical protein